MTEIEKDKLIKSELKKLNDIFKDLPKDKNQLASKLVEQATFMYVTLKELSEDINANGAIILFKNGKQEMMTENPAQKSYNTMINRYSAVIKQLIDLLPKVIDKSATIDELEEFINNK